MVLTLSHTGVYVGREVVEKDLANKLKQSLISLMNEKGDIQKITTQAILDRANVSKATFYRHYRDKYELLNSTVMQMYRQTFEQNHKGYRFVLYHGLCLLKENRSLLANGLKYQGQNSLSKSLQENAEKYLYNLIAEHNPINLSEQSKFEIRFYCFGMVGVMEEWLCNGCKTDPSKLSKQILLQMSPYLQKIIFNSDTKC